MSGDAKNLATARRAMVDTLLGDGGADLVLRGGQVVNVITAEIYPAEVAVQDGFIVEVGDCEGLVGEGTKVVELDGATVIPGLIDAHMHFESAMLTATEFTRKSLPTGTTTIVSDPHEIGNVLGPEGMRQMAIESATLPNRILTRVPCRVPDVPGVETAGEDIGFAQIPEMLEYPSVDGIGEIQGVSAPQIVYNETPEVFDDLIASTIYAREHGKTVDGNAAAIFGHELAAHVIAGGTDVSCHETATKEECVAKLRAGVYVLMREGSTNRNMPECIRAYTEDGMDPRRLCLCTDDMLPEDLGTTGHMNEVVRRTIAAGIEPAVAVQMATINPATWMGLGSVGWLAPGKVADLVVVGSLEQMDVRSVYVAGDHVAEDGELLVDIPAYTYPESTKRSVKRGPVEVEELAVAADGETATVRLLGLIADKALCDGLEAELPVVDGFIRADPVQDAAHIAVVERHGRTAGSVGRGFIRGFGVRRGAIAQTVSHDTHNLMVMGADLDDMAKAANEVIAMQGGLAVVADGEVIGSLHLPIAGLVTDALTADEVAEAMAKLTETVRTELGIGLTGPFMQLGFVSLATSPRWKITDQGLVAGDTYEIQPPLIAA
ncbi:MAG: adenine deaminase C-terminal domain-containing protein [Solirubrobacterales bacterium]